MVPIDPMMGEFRVHYAGFFDPGFGFTEQGHPGSRAVLEVRSHEVPFVLEDGQAIGRLDVRADGGDPRYSLRPDRDLELPGPGPQALQAFPELSATTFRLPGDFCTLCTAGHAR